MKTERHAKIIELINEKPVCTQEELATALRDSGFDVTQATVSRDIRDLRLTKRQDKDGRQRYVESTAGDDTLNTKYANVLKEGYVSMAVAGNLLVIKTVPGMAMAVCAAVDAFGFREEVGSIAGDDTIMIAALSRDEAERLGEKIGKYC